jgi:CheY-like chemotaxis protein
MSTCLPLRILIVEDNEDVGEMLCLLLEAWGHRAELRTDGVAGAMAAIASHYDLLILDLGLPGIDGFEVARRVRETRGREPLIVALSGYTLPEHVQLARAVGFDHHLGKPIGDEALRRVLRIAKRRRDVDAVMSGEVEVLDDVMQRA